MMVVALVGENRCAAAGESKRLKFYDRTRVLVQIIRDKGCAAVYK